MRVLPKNTTQCPLPGFEPRQFNPEFSALTMMPPTTEAYFFFQADLCPPGYYCPEGTGYRFSNPCPVGFYRKLSAAVSVQDCSVCFSGHFCSVLGLADPKICPEVRQDNLNN